MANKVAKASVDYRKGSPRKHCALCTMFQPPHGCSHVAGNIDADDVCDDFKPLKRGDDWYEPKTRRLQIIRHGATKDSTDKTSVDVVRSWTDQTLSDEGKKEAKDLAAKMAADKKDLPDHICSSDLERAEATAKIIAAKTKVPFEESDKALRSWNAGELVGKKTKDALPVFKDYIKNKPDEAIPQGESFHAFELRLFGGLLALFERYDGVLAIVTHQRCHQTLHAWGKAGFPADGSVDIKQFDKQGEPTASRDFLDIPMEKLRQVVANRKASMAEKKRDWYGDKKEGEQGGGVKDRHERERKEMHGRHQKARDALQKQHEDEIQSMMDRHDAEMQAEAAQPATQAAAQPAPPPAAAAATASPGASPPATV